jgi:fermentation-respiration switch protein FrsA (DUF1100 family)
MKTKNNLPAIKEILRKISPKNKYIPIEIETDFGRVECRYYEAGATKKGVIWVGGVGGDFDSPDDNLYPNLSEKLQTLNIASLRVKYRRPTSLKESALDTLTGIAFLKEEGIDDIALVGHSLGGAVVVNAAAISQLPKTVVTLSTQSYGATDAVRKLPENCSILLIHGDNDKTLDPENSTMVFNAAHEKKEIIILKGNGHVLNESPNELSTAVYDWIQEELS